MNLIAMRLKAAHTHEGVSRLAGDVIHVSSATVADWLERQGIANRAINEHPNDEPVRAWAAEAAQAMAGASADPIETDSTGESHE